MASAHSSSETKVSSSPWRGFAPGTWQSRVNVREFIQRNYTSYEGDGKFLQGATERTQGLWQKLLPLLAPTFRRKQREAEWSLLLTHRGGFTTT